MSYEAFDRTGSQQKEQPLSYLEIVFPSTQASRVSKDDTKVDNTQTGKSDTPVSRPEETGQSTDRAPEARADAKPITEREIRQTTDLLAKKGLNDLSDAERKQVVDFFTRAYNEGHFDAVVKRVDATLQAQGSNWKLDSSTTFGWTRGSQPGFLASTKEMKISMSPRDGQGEKQSLQVLEVKGKEKLNPGSRETLDDEEKDKAKRFLDDEIDKSAADFSDKDKKTIKELAHAIVDGDVKKVDEVLKRYKDNPKELAAIMMDLQKHLKGPIGIGYTVTDGVRYTPDGVKSDSEGKFSLTWYGATVNFSTLEGKPPSMDSMARSEGSTAENDVQMAMDIIRTWTVRWLNHPEPKPENPGFGGIRLRPPVERPPAERPPQPRPPIWRRSQDQSSPQSTGTGARKEASSDRTPTETAPRSDAQSRPADQAPTTESKDASQAQRGDTDSENDKAEENRKTKEKLDERINDPARKLSERDRQLLKRLEHAIIDGDPYAIGKLVKQFEKNPKDLNTVMLALVEDMKSVGVDVEWRVEDWNSFRPERIDSLTTGTLNFRKGDRTTTFSTSSGTHVVGGNSTVMDDVRKALVNKYGR